MTFVGKRSKSFKIRWFWHVLTLMNRLRSGMKWRRKTAWPLGGAPWRCSKQLRGCQTWQTSSGRQCRQCRQVRKLWKTRAKSQVFSRALDKTALQANLNGFRRFLFLISFSFFFQIHRNHDVMASSQALELNYIALPKRQSFAKAHQRVQWKQEAGSSH
jgi:hypothetical protein